MLVLVRGRGCDVQPNTHVHVTSTVRLTSVVSRRGEVYVPGHHCDAPRKYMKKSCTSD